MALGTPPLGTPSAGAFGAPQDFQSQYLQAAPPPVFAPDANALFGQPPAADQFGPAADQYGASPSAAPLPDPNAAFNFADPSAAAAAAAGFNLQQQPSSPVGAPVPLPAPGGQLLPDFAPPPPTPDAATASMFSPTAAYGFPAAPPAAPAFVDPAFADPNAFYAQQQPQAQGLAAPQNLPPQNLPTVGLPTSPMGVNYLA